MSEQIRRMFAGIAPRYDLNNRVLTFGFDQQWRRLAVRRSAIALGQSVLDCAAGTGDLALAFKRTVGERGQVVALDFCPDMLELLRRKVRRAGMQIETVTADMLALPFADNSFDCASCAFGIRNVDDPILALREMARVVRPGGSVIILETGQPRGPLAPFARLYSRVLLPRIGGWLSGAPEAYAYLQRSSAGFPSGSAFVELLEEAHPFSRIESWPLVSGVAWLYRALV